MLWIWGADAVVALHLAYLAFIPFGGVLAWRWPRIAWAHLAAIAIAVTSITIGFDCPLTTWEQSLRRRGGQTPYTNGFVDHYLAGHIYPHGYDITVQVIFGLCIVASYALVARRPRATRAETTRSPTSAG